MSLKFFFSSVRSLSRSVASRRARLERAFPKSSPFSAETLETRTLLSTVTLSSGVLTFTASNGFTNVLSIVHGSSTYEFLDSAEPITTSIPGATGSGTNDVTVPKAGVTSIRALLLDGDDSVNVEPADVPIAIDTGGGDDALRLFGDGNNISFSPDESEIAQIGAEDVTYDNTETVGIQGPGGVLLVHGSSPNDRFDINFDNGASTFTSAAAPGVTYMNFLASGTTFDDVSGGFDVVAVHGSQAPDLFSSGPSSVILSGFSPVNIGSGIDTLEIDAFAGDDTINLSSYSKSPTHVLAGDGNDAVSGSPLNDLIEGGAGDDTLFGNNGQDRIEGGDGNDSISGGSGFDTLFGGDGSDLFTWDFFDGSSIIEGGGDADRLVFNAGSGDDAVNLFADAINSTRVHITDSTSVTDLSIAGSEQIDVNAGDGADTVTAGRDSTNGLSTLETTELKLLNIDLGAADAAADNIYVDGTIGDDNIAIAQSSGIVTVQGLVPKVRITNEDLFDVDVLHVRGNEGDDKIVANSPVEQLIALDLDGGTGTNTIVGGAAQPTMSIADASITEGNSGTKLLVFKVTLSQPSAAMVSAAVNTSSGTAVSGSDYNGFVGTVDFAPFQTTQTISIAIRGDTTVEANETFQVKLKSPVNAAIADGAATGTIINDDSAASAFQLSVKDGGITEGKSGTKTVTIVVTLSKKSGKAITVQYATANGTASSGEDYVAKSGTLTFAAGQTSKTISLTIKGDTKKEADEDFFVNLFNPGNAVIGDGKGRVLIKNDD